MACHADVTAAQRIQWCMIKKLFKKGMASYTRRSKGLPLLKVLHFMLEVQELDQRIIVLHIFPERYVQSWIDINSSSATLTIENKR